ncbi:MAG: helix-turn-helix transcriptional regulator [Mesorhizobium sp.]|uniref:winged helix-turn-helix transcriptional regulator n=1 Tax=Mesorhizobium sp. TaxID=1871066 RepID=UPI0012217681|nr:helix-turn-helix domain-containing protein [Mesorhizobium sp.]TIP24248.1 MAG: helix-turn-helix transcriptional regulator [Mesorhizobium sp.]
MATNLPEACGLGPAFRVINGKWKGTILWLCRKQPRRPGELRRLIPDVSEKMLIQHLREMVADGLLDRHDFGEIPPRVEYSVTDLGRELDDVLAPLAHWGLKHADRLTRDHPMSVVKA